MPAKTNKELAFLHELFVATDWGERFAELIDEQVQLPKKGRALYVASGTGGHAIAIQERSSESLKFLCVDENEDSLELSRAKATALQDGTEFREGKVDQLALDDNSFNLVVGDGSLVHSERIPEMLSELVRVAAPGATVALTLPTFSSFGEFFSIYWEVLHNSTTRIEEFDYDSAEKFLRAPLIADFLMPIWLETLPRGASGEVVTEIARLIKEESHEMEFALTVKATLVIGKKV
jgi:ubiquinone/menaquinone biosynthesis C-methylase UbiE